MAAAPKRFSSDSDTDKDASTSNHSDPSNSKKCRFTEIPEFSKQLTIRVASCVSGLTDALLQSACFLTPLQITNCNAAVPEEGFSFSNASCSVLPVEPMHVFGSIFGKGVRILLDYLDEKLLPESKQEKHVLNKLIQYLLDTDSHDRLEKAAEDTDTDLTLLLTNHLFTELTASPFYYINKQSRRKQSASCPCGKPGCKITGQYGDTSLGHREVWHGSADIIINDRVVLEHVTETDPDNPGERSSSEFQSGSLERNPRIIAETIVFSFLQKQMHAEYDHFIFPCIAVSGKDLVFYFYDSENDVLLESSRIPLFRSKPGYQLSLDFVAVIACWLVINYKYLSSGLPESLSVSSKNAGFFIHATLKLPIYESSLKSGNVGISSQSKKFCRTVDTSDEIILEASRKILKIYKQNFGSVDQI